MLFIGKDERRSVKWVLAEEKKNSKRVRRKNLKSRLLGARAPGIELLMSF